MGSVSLIAIELEGLAALGEALKNNIQLLQLLHFNFLQHPAQRLVKPPAGLADCIKAQSENLLLGWLLVKPPRIPNPGSQEPGKRSDD